MKVYRYWIENWQVKEEIYNCDIEDDCWVWEENELFMFSVDTLDSNKEYTEYYDSGILSGLFYSEKIEDKINIINIKKGNMQDKKISARDSYERELQKIWIREKELSVLSSKYCK